MKKKIIKMTVPAYEMTHTTYQCETCGKSYQDKEFIQECPICGKDVCSNCRKICYIAKNVLYFDTSSKSFILTNDYHDDGEAVKVCESCYNK